MIALVNPTATAWRYRVPLSILSVAAGLEGAYEYEVIDGNIDRNLLSTLPALIEQKGIRYVGFTVMPGPQLNQAIELSQIIRKRFPKVVTIWGGYFPTLHKQVVLRSGYVDYVVRDQGDYALRKLIDTLEKGGNLEDIKGLSFINAQGDLVNNAPQELIDPNTLPVYPYHKVDVAKYVSRTFLGSRTINYHSSVGCPFLCGFCAVAVVYKARWMGTAAERVANEILQFKANYGVNAVEFFDNNFFTSEKRTHEFADRMTGEGVSWWGEARPDTVMQYDDSTWKAMQAGGCKMIFFGAESSSQKTLDLMNKGGTQTPDTVLAMVDRMRSYNIVPELSFVLGNPSDDIDNDLEQDFNYIRKIKKINPKTEIIIYVYSPVYFDDAELFETARTYGFSYPSKLDDWLLPQWRNHDLRKTPVTPWLKERHLIRIRNFEKVLNAVFPTNSDLKQTPARKRILGLLGSWRYQLGFYDAPYEIMAMQKAFRYRQPEIEGF